MFDVTVSYQKINLSQNCAFCQLLATSCRHIGLFGTDSDYLCKNIMLPHGLRHWIPRTRKGSRDMQTWQSRAFTSPSKRCSCVSRNYKWDIQHRAAVLLTMLSLTDLMRWMVLIILEGKGFKGISLNLILRYSNRQ